VDGQPALACRLVAEAILRTREAVSSVLSLLMCEGLCERALFGCATLSCSRGVVGGVVGEVVGGSGRGNDCGVRVIYLSRLCW